MGDSSFPSGLDYDFDNTDSESRIVSEERWAPLGAVADSSLTSAAESCSSGNSNEHTDHLREENERMANSLLSLTSHFAQVQFRLRQIINGPDDLKAERLKNLEDFAERGIPDVKSHIVTNTTNFPSDEVDEEYQRVLQQKHKETISELKLRLADMENYAYQSGLANDLPTSTVLEKQEIIIEEIKNKLHISHLDDLASLSSEQLKQYVNTAIAEMVNPMKAKEQQVEQLTTQVNDLERFIDFLQEATSDEVGDCNTNTGQWTNKYPSMTPGSRADFSPYIRTQGTGSSDKDDSTSSESRSSRIKRLASVIHLFIISELGCASRSNDKKHNQMKTSSSKPHFGDMLAEMQLCIDELLIEAEKAKQAVISDSIFDSHDYSSDEDTAVSENRELTRCVRKKFSIALRKLLEHGCFEVSRSRALMPLGACSSRNSILKQPQSVHIWKVILQYYKLKNGKAYNESPARTLADSFGIPNTIDRETTVKHTLLEAIGHVIETHTPYQRTDDAHFKAFISLALNAKSLVPWLRQIFRTTAIIDEFYMPWSYLVQTNLEDVLCAMNKLKMYEFNLPVDLAVKQFHNMKDAF